MPDLPKMMAAKVEGRATHKADYWYRDHLIPSIHQHLNHDGITELQISGEGGSGKTSLVKECLKAYKNKASIFAYKFSEHGQDHKLFFQQILLKMLETYGISPDIPENIFLRLLRYEFNFDDHDLGFFSQLWHKHYSQLRLDHYRSIILLILRAFKTDVIFFLDDMQWAPRPVTDFIEDIRNINIPKKIKIIQTSRLEHVRESAHQIINMALKPLEYAEFLDYMSKTLDIKISARDMEILYNKSKGNFFIIHSIVNIIKNNHKKSHKTSSVDISIISNDLQKIILLPLHNMKINERRILELASCALVSLPSEAISYFYKDVSQKDIDGLLNAGYLKKTDSSNYFISHDLYKVAIYESIKIEDRETIHAGFVKVIRARERDELSRLCALAEHAWFSGNTLLSYKYNLLAAQASIRHFSPFQAVSYINRLLNILESYPSHKVMRNLTLLVLLCNAYIMMGSNVLIKDKIRELEAGCRLENITPKIKYEICNILSLFYWSYGDLDKCISVLNYFAETDDILTAENISPLFFFRYVGVLSDQGYFEDSNAMIVRYLGTNSHLVTTQFFGMHYQIKQTLLAVRARNCAHLNNKSEFVYLANDILQNLRHDFSVSEILALCFLADGFLAIGDFDSAATLALRGIHSVKKNNLTILNTFIFVILGYAESMRGDVSGLSKIKEAIEAAEIAERWSRVSLYYYYYAHAKKTLCARASIKRLILTGIKIAQRNGEHWIEGKLKSLL